MVLLIQKIESNGKLVGDEEVLVWVFVLERSWEEFFIPVSREWEWDHCPGRLSILEAGILIWIIVLTILPKSRCNPSDWRVFLMFLNERIEILFHLVRSNKRNSQCYRNIFFNEVPYFVLHVQVFSFKCISLPSWHTQSLVPLFFNKGTESYNKLSCFELV